MIIGRLLKTSLQAVALASLPLALACGNTTGASVEFKPASSQSESPIATTSGARPIESTDLSPRLGFVQGSEATAMENGGRVPLGDDRIAEVFLAPYPPGWQTDLHLFLLDKETFQPITEVEVDLTYDMVFMDHGIDAQIGTKIADGHYVLPLSFLMYGDWSVDTTLKLPEGKRHLRFVVKFYPGEG